MYIPGTADSRKKQARLRSRTESRFMQRNIDTGALSQLYIGYREQSPVIVVEYTLKEAVDEEKLQNALTAAIRVFPAFRVRLALNEKRQPVYEENELPPCVYADDGRSHAFGRESGGYLFRLSCCGRRIKLSLHHMLTDVTGANAFLVYILRCYLHQIHPAIDISEHTIPLDPRDLRDPYDLYGDMQADGYDMSSQWENELVIPNHMQYRRYENYPYRTIVFPVERLLAAAKKTDSSAFPLLFWLMANAAIRTYNAEDKILVASGAANYRTLCGSKTPLNFSRSFSTVFLPRERHMSLETQLTVQRAKMDLQLDRETVRREIAVRKAAIAQKTGPIEAYVLDQEALEKKRKAAERKSAFYLSYSGKNELPADIAGYVDGFYVNSPTARGPLRTTAYSWGENIYLHISEQSCETSIVPAMTELLHQYDTECRTDRLTPYAYDYFPMEELLSS